MTNTTEQDKSVQMVRPRKRELSNGRHWTLSATIFLQFRTHI